MNAWEQLTERRAANCIGSFPVHLSAYTALTRT